MAGTLRLVLSMTCARRRSAAAWSAWISSTLSASPEAVFHSLRASAAAPTWRWSLMRSASRSLTSCIRSEVLVFEPSPGGSWPGGVFAGSGFFCSGVAGWLPEGPVPGCPVPAVFPATGGGVPGRCPLFLIASRSWSLKTKASIPVAPNASRTRMIPPGFDFRRAGRRSRRAVPAADLRMPVVRCLAAIRGFGAAAFFTFAGAASSLLPDMTLLSDSKNSLAD